MIRSAGDAEKESRLSQLEERAARAVDRAQQLGGRELAEAVREEYAHPLELAKRQLESTVAGGFLDRQWSDFMEAVDQSLRRVEEALSARASLTADERKALDAQARALYGPTLRLAHEASLPLEAEEVFVFPSESEHAAVPLRRVALLPVGRDFKRCADAWAMLAFSISRHLLTRVAGLEHALRVQEGVPPEEEGAWQLEHPISQHTLRTLTADVLAARLLGGAYPKALESSFGDTTYDGEGLEDAVPRALRLHLAEHCVDLSQTGKRQRGERRSRLGDWIERVLLRPRDPLAGYALTDLPAFAPLGSETEQPRDARAHLSNLLLGSQTGATDPLNQLLPSRPKEHEPQAKADPRPRASRRAGIRARDFQDVRSLTEGIFVGEALGLRRRVEKSLQPFPPRRLLP